MEDKKYQLWASSIHWSNKYISNASYVFGTLSSMGDMRVNKADVIPA